MVHQYQYTNYCMSRKPWLVYSLCENGQDSLIIQQYSIIYDYSTEQGVLDQEADTF